MCRSIESREKFFRSKKREKKKNIPTFFSSSSSSSSGGCRAKKKILRSFIQGFVDRKNFGFDRGEKSLFFSHTRDRYFQHFFLSSFFFFFSVFLFSFFFNQNHFLLQKEQLKDKCSFDCRRRK